MHLRDAARRVHRMLVESGGDDVSVDEAQSIAQGLLDEQVPSTNPDHKLSVLAAVKKEASLRAPDAIFDRSFRRALDQGTTHVGAGKLIDAIRPQFGLLPWTYWLAVALLLIVGIWVLPLLDRGDAHVLAVIVPLFGLIGLYYTLRASHHGVREWERSCPVTPFQLALARIVVVLLITLAVSFIASFVFVRQDMGTSLIALIISWLAPLLFITGLYLVADVLVGGMAGSAAGAVAWFAHLLLTQGGRVATSVASSVDSFVVSRLDGVSFLLGVGLLALGLILSSSEVRNTYDHRVL